MTVATLLRYLLGDRNAILTVAATPGALWLGILFVFSAALAREYDAKDLLSEPWYLLLPLGASLATSFVLYCLVRLVARSQLMERLAFWPTFRTFLTLYWMTAPLAWLYALPVEQFFSSGGATAANLSLLGVVSVWRVALMTRIVAVVFGSSAIAAFWTVMLFADTVAMIVLFVAPLPIFNIMGGIPLSEGESMILGAAMWVGCLGAPSWFLWLIGVIFIGGGGRIWHSPLFGLDTRATVSTGLWALSITMILCWAAILPITQPPQRLRQQVETKLRAGELSSALDTMSLHEPGDFPPHFDPPPWLGYADPRPPLIEVMEMMARRRDAPWVRDAYIRKVFRVFPANSLSGYHWRTMEPQERDRWLTIFEQLPLVDGHARELRELWRQEEDAARKDRLRVLLESAGYETAPPGADEG